MKKWFSVLCIILLLLTAFPALAQETVSVPAWRAYNGKRLGVLTGPLMEDIARKNFPDSEYLLFNSYPDCITALLAGRIDAYLSDEPGVKSVHAEQPKIDYIHERITNQDYSFAFRRNDPASAALCEELNAFLALSRENGVMQELDDIWFGVDEARKVVDMSDLTGEKGTIRVVTTSTDMPWSYIKDGKNVGYDIDLVVRFCRHAGYKLELGDVDFAARIPAVQSGKYDFTTDMNVTEERKGQVLFSDPTSSGGVVLAVLTDGSQAGVLPDQLETVGQGSIEKQPITSLSMLAQPGVNIAVGLDTPAEEALARDYPNAKLVPYTDIVLAYMDVAKGRMDACVSARTEMEFAIQNGFTGVRLLDENYISAKIAVGISPVSTIPDLKGKLNAFIAELKADGTLDDMYDRWVIRSEDTMPDNIPRAEKPAFTLRVGTTGSVMPYSYFVGTELAGYDIELANRFAGWLGAELELKVYDFDGIVPAAEAGSIDCIMSNLFYTEEKDQAIPFSDVLFEVQITAMVRSDGQGQNSASTAEYTSLSQLNGKRIGVQTGTSFDKAVFEQLPDAEVSYYNTKADLISALLTYKIDGYTVDEPVVKVEMHQDERLTYIPEYMENFEFAYVFPKTEAGQALRDQFSEYLRTIRQDGTMAQIETKWFSEDDTQKTLPDYKAFPAPNGTLRMATEALYEPFTYIMNNEIVGYDIDIAVRFCEAYGYGLEIVDMSFDAVLPSVYTGKCDFGGSGITITAERAESVLFSEPSFIGGTVMAVLKAETAPVTAAEGVYKTLDELNGRNIGVQTGQSFDAMISARLPEATLTYYNNKADLINALITGKIVSYAADEPVAKVQMQENDKLTYVPEYLDSFEFGYVFAKNEEGAKLRDQMNEYLKKIQADGTLAEIDRQWFSLNDAEKTLPDYQSFPAPNGTLRLATEALYEPFSYIKNNEIVGYDIDIIVRFCEACGYGLEIEDMNFAGILPAVQSRKNDIGCAGITITAERAESVYFSDSNYSGGTVMMVLKAETPAVTSTTDSNRTESFWESIKASFNKTFLRENRWKLFLEGVGNTMLITLLSILFGTALGFLLFMLCRNANIFANSVTRFSIWLVTGTPMVVLLMILYYIIFGSVAISGIAVAVIGFTLTFGATVFGLLKIGVGTIDRGQYEAAYALGHSNRHTFFKIILPQAIPHVLPAYQDEIVGLIKATAIVGYIAVQDLTKMGDIVRSRTYEAFFPLIAVTVIYFVLEGLFSFAVSRIRISIDPKKRKRDRILKGVNIHD